CTRDYDGKGEGGGKTRWESRSVSRSKAGLVWEQSNPAPPWQSFAYCQMSTGHGNATLGFTRSWFQSSGARQPLKHQRAIQAPPQATPFAAAAATEVHVTVSAWVA